MKITLPTGETAFLPGATPEVAAQHERFLQARYDFAKAYAERQGWGNDPSECSIEQILEIRKQPGWVTPAGMEPQKTSATLVPGRSHG